MSSEKQNCVKYVFKHNVPKHIFDTVLFFLCKYP